MKNQKGITLIALIITIIVMLILVGVSVSTAINTGLFKTASGVAQNTEAKRDEELDVANGLVNIGKGGKTDINKYVEDITAEKPKFTHTDTNNNGILDVGEEVTHIKSGEGFYVIGTEDTEVTLLAKYNLNEAGTAQLIDSEAIMAFSSTAYWWDEDANDGEGGYTQEYIDSGYDLNKCPVPEGVTSIITTVKEYGKSIGGEGRLLTATEIEGLEYDILELAFDAESTYGTLSWIGCWPSSQFVYDMALAFVDFDIFDDGLYPAVKTWGLTGSRRGVRPSVTITIKSIEKF